jgi:Domain of unknown function (DUF4864)
VLPHMVHDAFNPFAISKTSTSRQREGPAMLLTVQRLLYHPSRWLATACIATTCITAALLTSAAWAQTAAPPATTLSAQDEKAALAVVQAQLAAFAADDATKAFSYASPQIQKAFGTPKNFLAMVRQQYPVVYRPAATAFFKPETHGGGVLLRVQMTDANAAQWLAVYSLQKPTQKSQPWRIAGCMVVANTARSA